MTLLLRSLAQGRYVVLGALVLLFGFQLVIVGQAAEIARANSFSRMAELLPGFVTRGLGSRALVLASFKGTVSFGYFHPVVSVLITLVAMYLATEPAHEIESGLVDLELARPVRRTRLLTRSLLLAVLSIVCGVLLMRLGTWSGVWLFGAGDLDVPSPRVLGFLLLHLAGVATCFTGFALFLGAGARRWSTAFTTAALTVVVMYLVEFLTIGWRSMSAIAWVSPFHYYPALSIIIGDAPMARDLCVLFSVGAAFSAAAYWRFQRRDL